MTRSTTLARLFALAAIAMLAVPSSAADGHGHDHAKTAEADAHVGEDHAHDEETHHDDDQPKEAEHAFEVGGLKVVHPWMNATDGREALIFLELENSGETSVTIDGAEIPFAKTAALVGFALKRGEGTYLPLPFMPVQPGRSLELAPQGLAIRATGLAASFSEGETAEIKLLTSAGPIAVMVAVEANDAQQHSHAGHAH